MISYDELFRRLTDRDPFPYQRRLAEGEWPHLLDVPTGLGKTAAVLVAFLHRRMRGDSGTGRRLVYVVDRRAVVDQATDEAVRLRERIDLDPELKRALGLRNGQSLSISTLRGQFVDNREWLEDPAAPAIIVGTVDMVGSRLLFEGYGVSRKMRPYHAGLLGADTLVALDEAHLVPPFEQLLRAVADELALRPRGERWVPPFRLLSLSATGRTRTAEVAGLSESDFKNPVVQQRLHAQKALRIVPLDDEQTLEHALATHAWALADQGRKVARVIVYSNSREVAQAAKRALEKLAGGDKKKGKPAIEIGTELFVGARRVFERQRARDGLRELGFIAGSEAEVTRPTFLFATSAGEVGVDLDADHMVCDLVEWERMVQRLGRVNRRGNGTASVVVLVEPKPKATGNEQKALDRQESGADLDRNERKQVEAYAAKIRRWENRQKPIVHLRRTTGGAFDASPAGLDDLARRARADAGLRRILADATSPEPLRPALTRPLVDAWAMTSLEKHPGRPAIQPWLRGWSEDDPPQTTVVWRTHLPVRTGGAPRKKEIEDFFEAAPPHASELLETETCRVLEWVGARAEHIGDQPSEPATTMEAPSLREDDTLAYALDPAGGLRASLTLRSLKTQVGEQSTKEQRDEFSKLLKGATLVVDARLGGLTDGLLDEKACEPPPTADGGEWLGGGVVRFRVRSAEAPAALSRDPQWHERFRFASEVTAEGETTRWLVVEKWRHDAANEDDRSAANPQLLEEHQSWTEERARQLAVALGLKGEYAELLALAARLHDEGKRAARWQRAFHAPDARVYAKTSGPIDFRLLDGYRHELGSLLRGENDERVRALPEEHRDLVLHLIAAHHGFARPVIGTSGCEEAPPSVLAQRAAEIALRFARLQAVWGPWGLAWWEALLRAADQQASRENDARGASAGAA